MSSTTPSSTRVSSRIKNPVILHSPTSFNSKPNPTLFTGITAFIDFNSSDGIPMNDTLSKKLQERGATIAKKHNSNITHYIINSNSKPNTIENAYKLSQSSACLACVSPLWIDQSIKDNELALELNFQVDISNVYNQLKLPDGSAFKSSNKKLKSMAPKALNGPDTNSNQFSSSPQLQSKKMNQSNKKAKTENNVKPNKLAVNEKTNTSFNLNETIISSPISNNNTTTTSLDDIITNHPNRTSPGSSTSGKSGLNFDNLLDESTFTPIIQNSTKCNTKTTNNTNALTMNTDSKLSTNMDDDDISISKLVLSDEKSGKKTKRNKRNTVSDTITDDDFAFIGSDNSNNNNSNKKLNSSTTKTVKPQVKKVTATPTAISMPKPTNSIGNSTNNNSNNNNNKTKPLSLTDTKKASSAVKRKANQLTIETKHDNDMSDNDSVDSVDNRANLKRESTPERKSCRVSRKPAQLLLQQPSISFTNVSDSTKEILIQTLDAKFKGFDVLVNSIDTTPVTHLVIEKPARTMKILFGIARGCWILTPDWILSMLDKNVNRIPKEELYEFKAYPGIEISRKIVANHEKRLLHNKKMYVHKDNIKPDKLLLCELIKELDGTVVNSYNECDICVASENINVKKVQANSKCNSIIVNVQWLFDSIGNYSIQSTTKYLIQDNNDNDMPSSPGF